MAQQNIPDNSNLKVSAGKPLTADLWNRVIERLPSTDAGAGTSVSLINKTVVQCKAHRDIDIAEVLGVSSYLGVDDDVYEIAPSHILELSAVVWPDDCHQIVIAERPVLTDEIGPFAYNGGAIVNLDQSLAGDYAFPDPADTTQMKRSTSGYRILNLVNTSQAVVSLGDTQPLWKYQLTSAYAGTATGQAKILTLNDGVFKGTPQTINFAADCKPDSLDVGHVGYVVFANGAFWVTDFCSTGGTGTPRIRFKLINKFNDTGQADADVLDTFGETGFVRGDPVVVNDPRKLFAHAIGESNINITPNTYFPCGGSVGYAVLTQAPDIEPPSTADYPRWEVEQCTQTIEKMRVWVYVDDASGGPHQQPTGQTVPPEPSLTLYFSNLNAVQSRWPDVDYCESWSDSGGGSIPYTYKVENVTNPHRFSAISGSWCIIEKTTWPQRAEDSCNDLTPYAGMTGIPDEWVITDVQKPLARWIRVKYLQDTDPKWEYDSEFAEGDSPVLYFPPAIPLNTKIRTAPGMVTGCLVEGEKGWAFWDPNEQFYNVVMTNSALYGSPVDVKILGSTDTVSDLLTETECTISYPEMTSVPVFGIKPDECLVEPVTNSISLANESIAVVTGYTIDPADPTAVCLNSTVIYVCKTETGPDLPCFDVCDPCEPTGCCQYPTGTYTPGMTKSECDAISGDWVEGDCPELCFECYECNSGYGIKFDLDNISWDASASTSGFAGGADIATAVWANPTSGSDCCAKLTVTFKNEDTPALTAIRVAEVCMQSSATCTTSHELVLDWDVADFDGCTLPTVLGCVTSSSPCVNEYGTNSVCIIPVNPSATGNWDEVVIHTLACDP